MYFLVEDSLFCLYEYPLFCLYQNDQFFRPHITVRSLPPPYISQLGCNGRKALWQDEKNIVSAIERSHLTPRVVLKQVHHFAVPFKDRLSSSRVTRVSYIPRMLLSEEPLQISSISLILQ